MGFENQQLSFEQLLEQVKQLDAEKKDKLIKEVFSDEEYRKHVEIDAILHSYHTKFEQTYIDLA